MDSPVCCQQGSPCSDGVEAERRIEPAEVNEWDEVTPICTTRGVNGLQCCATGGQTGRWGTSRMASRSLRGTAEGQRAVALRRRRPRKTSRSSCMSPELPAGQHFRGESEALTFGGIASSTIRSYRMIGMRASPPRRNSSSRPCPTHPAGIASSASGEPTTRRRMQRIHTYSPAGVMTSRRRLRARRRDGLASTEACASTLPAGQQARSGPRTGGGAPLRCAWSRSRAAQYPIKKTGRRRIGKARTQYTLPWKAPGASSSTISMIAQTPIMPPACRSQQHRAKGKSRSLRILCNRGSSDGKSR